MPADGSEQRQTAPKDPQHQAKTQLILVPACAKLAEAFIFPLRRHSAIPLRFSCRTLHKPLFTFRQACPERSRRAQGERRALWFRLKTVRAEPVEARTRIVPVELRHGVSRMCPYDQP